MTYHIAHSTYKAARRPSRPDCPTLTVVRRRDNNIRGLDDVRPVDDESKKYPGLKFKSLLSQIPEILERHCLRPCQLAVRTVKFIV